MQVYYTFATDFENECVIIQQQKLQNNVTPCLDYTHVPIQNNSDVQRCINESMIGFIHRSVCGGTTCWWGNLVMLLCMHNHSTSVTEHIYKL